MKLTAENVYNIFFACLYDNDVIAKLKPDEVPEGAVIVDGITIKVGFQPDRLEKAREDIKSMLSELPDNFMHDKGGGYSFLGACETKEGVHWAEHRTMEQLFLLGQALKVVRPCLPRELWSALPGGVPYYAVNLDGFEQSESPPA